MTELISILDLNMFRPNKEYFRGIDWEQEFVTYMAENSECRNVQSFYFDKLIEFLRKELRSNRNQKIKKRFIIYVMTRGILMNRLANKFREAMENDENLAKLKIVFGSNSLFLYLGSIIKEKRWFVRFYSKYLSWLSSDLIDEFKENFQNWKLVYGAWNTFSTKTIEADVSRFNSPNFEIK